MKYVTHQQVVAGRTTAGPLAVLLSRFVLWMRGETVEKLHNELLGANAELTYLRGLLSKRYVGEWKTTKDGTKRYRKVATKVLVNAWVTESEPIAKEPLDGQLYGTDTVVSKEQVELHELDW